MCDLTNEFKLCTCDFESSKAKYTWKLFRKKSTTIQVIDGQYFVPEKDWKTLSLSEIIELYINQKNKHLFDKEIDIYEKDRLVFYKEKELILQFEFSMNKWWLKNSKKSPNVPMINKGHIEIANKKITNPNFLDEL